LQCEKINLAGYSYMFLCRCPLPPTIMTLTDVISAAAREFTKLFVVTRVD
jgi:hypothetical protein